mgnify:CR=1 FL=1|jgi:hypothetical protein
MADRTWNPPNFTTSSSFAPAHHYGITGKQEGYSGVTTVRDTSIDFTGSNAGAVALFLPVAVVGSASFANGTSVSLADLATDTVYPIHTTQVSASGHVLVFKT